ncbi:MAG: IS1380 family transposase [Clostridium sp.]
MGSLLEKSTNFNSKIKFNFGGGDLTSDSGLLLYKEFDVKIGLSKAIKENLIVKDSAKFRTHTNSDIAIQKIYQNIAGYHTDDNADELTIDPAFKAVLGKSALASQPSLSRYNNRVDKDNIKQFESINELLLDRIYSIDMPGEVLLDLDSTNCATYGDQYGSDYNSHYSANGFHPLVGFDGLTGDFIKAELRSGNVYTSRQVTRFVGPILKSYKSKYPLINRFVRADSGFAVPELYKLIENNNAFYAIRLKAYKTLYVKAANLTWLMDYACKDNIYDYKVMYGEIMFKAKSWDKERRVAVKIEKPEGQMCYNYTFIVTNMESTPKNIIKFYSNRGTMENFIKESKNGFAFDSMSSTNFVANANKLQLAMLAYNFNNWFRRIALSKSMQSNRIETIRLKLVKIAAKIVNSSRYLTFKLCSSCPYKNEFWDTLNRINNLAISP